MLACASSGEGLSGDDIPYLLLRRARLIPAGNNSNEIWKLIRSSLILPAHLNVRFDKSAYAQTIRRTHSYPSQNIRVDDFYDHCRNRRRPT